MRQLDHSSALVCYILVLQFLVHYFIQWWHSEHAQFCKHCHKSEIELGHVEKEIIFCVYSFSSNSSATIVKNSCLVTAGAIPSESSREADAPWGGQVHSCRLPYCRLWTDWWDTLQLWTKWAILAGSHKSLGIIKQSEGTSHIWGQSRKSSEEKQETGTKTGCL